MSWFRKTLNEELSRIIASLEVDRINLENFQQSVNKLKDLQSLESTDLYVIRKINYIHQTVKDNPVLYSRILQIAVQLRNELDTLIKLVKISSNVPQEKIELAKKIIVDLEVMIKEDLQQIKLFRGMTLAQVINLGIEFEIFYTAVGKDDLQRLLTGQGTWPNDWDRANLGIGVYAFDSLNLVRKYKEIREKTLRERDINEKLSIVCIVFSEASIREMKKNGKEIDLRFLDPEEYGDWMERHSSYGQQNVSGGKIKQSFLHRFFHVISMRAQGMEHYFRPECLEEAAVEVID